MSQSCGLLRFAAAVGLAMKLEGHPQKAAILEALERRRLGRIDAFFENFLTELAVTGAYTAILLMHAAAAGSSRANCKLISPVSQVQRA